MVVSGPASTLQSSAHTESFAVPRPCRRAPWSWPRCGERENGPDRGDSLATILGSPTLRGQISTVDDLDLAQGPTTAILTLLAAQAGEIGHYGVGDGADAAAPPPPGPPTTTTVP